MTAEVGVINKLGVALAADSAVTVSSNPDKIYTSADKLFQLSLVAPVGAMVYGNADFMGLPWETIVKSYRRALGNRTFPTLKAYGNHFVEFLASSVKLFPEASQDRFAEELANSLFFDLRGRIELEFNRVAKQTNRQVPARDLPALIARVVSDRLARVRNGRLLPRHRKLLSKPVRIRYKRMLLSARRKLFGKLPLTSAIQKDVEEIYFQMLGRHIFSPMQSGFVLAGFGDDEFMPALFGYEFDGVVAGNPRYWESQDAIMGKDSTAAVMPFAQQSVVRSFMEGIDPDLHELIVTSTAELFSRAMALVFGEAKKLDAALGQQLESALPPPLRQLPARLFAAWEQSRKENWAPIVDVVAVLPKDELAAMAEALVNLTKFRQRVTIQSETVGGPIDVAVITKGDGFVWVKRKHYFEPVLNPRTLARYGREGCL